ncbi:MAG: plasmid mobilization relaxosome protein MobC [Bacteroidetes bacterium]|nr:plasmid mobilization relaxosome protein MobC [Bacteroidota bacterium]
MNDKKDKWIHIRVSTNELQKINDEFSSSVSRKRSDFLRKKLFNKPVTIKYRNKSLDDFVSEMVQLKNELNAIGHNFNQTVKRLHTLSHMHELVSWAEQNEKHKTIFFQKVDEIKQHILKMAEQWSQESARGKV